VAEPILPKKRIVIVDDKPDIRDLIRLRLTLEPSFEVVGEAANGADAIEVARTVNPDALVLDLGMPVMSGEEAIPLLRAAVPATRIVVYSAKADLAELAGAALPDARVTKGGNLSELVKAIKSVLTGTQRERLAVDLGEIQLEFAVAAFDSWVGLNARIRESLAGGEALMPAQLSAVAAADLLALNSLFLRFGDPLLHAAQAGAATVHLRFDTTAEVGAAARRALVALGSTLNLDEFHAAWGHTVTPESLETLRVLRERLVAVLPAG